MPAAVSEAIVMSKIRNIPPVTLSTQELAKALGIRSEFLKRDRRRARVIPFYRLGDRIHYDLVRVREVLISLEQGGAQIKRRDGGAA